MKKYVLLLLGAAVLLAAGACQPAAAALGTEGNPIVWAFVPSGETQEILASGEELAGLVSERTGLVIDTNVATSYTAVIEAAGAKEAHMFSLATFSYLLANERYGVDTALVAVRFGAPFYTGQIIAGADTGITGLEDLRDKTVCWVDATSTSGYIIPRIELQAVGIDPDTDLAQQIEAGSHPNVVSAVYQGDCDAGATYVDARPTIADDFPDVNDKVIVIFESGEIPNDGVQFAADFPADLREQIVTALLEIAETEAGSAAMDTLYQWEDLVVRQDTFYDPFRDTLSAAGVDLEELGGKD